jgi:hypothetical protein
VSDVLITDEQYGELAEAIKNAKGPSMCRYVIKGQPGCVIGQLEHQLGVSVEQLEGQADNKIEELLAPAFISAKAWEIQSGTKNAFWDTVSGQAARQALSSYPVEVLKKLQNLWDAPVMEFDEDDCEALKTEMLNYLKKTYKVGRE